MYKVTSLCNISVMVWLDVKFLHWRVHSMCIQRRIPPHVHRRMLVRSTLPYGTRCMSLTPINARAQRPLTTLNVNNKTCGQNQNINIYNRDAYGLLSRTNGLHTLTLLIDLYWITLFDKKNFNKTMIWIWHFVHTHSHRHNVFMIYRYLRLISVLYQS